ncbi:MAG: YhbY family RNA-binding protein [Candidatus Woesearchaeota archaeon]|jgi:RNA-binding protein
MTEENLVAMSHVTKPTVWIGKKGMDPLIIEEIKKQLKAKKLIKVKILGGAIDEHNIDKKQFPYEVAKLVDAEVVNKIGFTFTLYKQ